MIGELLLGRYLVLKQLGAGGFSKTFLARDKYLPGNPPCVVKCLDSTEPVVRSMMSAEARALQELGRQCEQIPLLLAEIEDGNQSFIVQEYIEGSDLDQLSGNAIYSQEEVINLLLQVLPILKFVHAQGVVHRDIKPSNLIQSPDGQISLIDFGAALWLKPEEALEVDQKTVFVTDEGSTAIGTQGFMPREQQNGKTEFSSDLYALGMTAIQLVTGVSSRELTADVVSGEVGWQHHLKTPLNVEFVEILSKMVRLRPQHRYQQAAEVVTALKALNPSGIRVSPIPHIANSFRYEKPGIQKYWMIAGGSCLVLVISVVWGFAQYTQIPQLLGSFAATPSPRLKLRHQLPIQTDLKLLNAIAVSSDGDQLAGAKGNTLYIWSTASQNPVQQRLNLGSGITTLAFSPDEQAIATGNEPASLKIWDTANQKLIQEFAALGSPLAVVTFAPNQQLVVGASQNRIFVWDLRTGERRKVFAGHRAPIHQLLVSQDGRQLYSLGHDRILAWNLETGELIRVFPPESGGAMTGRLSNQRLTTVHAKSIQLWDLNTGNRIATEPNGFDKQAWNSLRCSEGYLVTQNSKQDLKIWELTGEKR